MTPWKAKQCQEERLRMCCWLRDGFGQAGRGEFPQSWGQGSGGQVTPGSPALPWHGAEHAMGCGLGVPSGALSQGQPGMASSCSRLLLLCAQGQGGFCTRSDAWGQQLLKLLSLQKPPQRRHEALQPSHCRRHLMNPGTN